MYEEDIAFHWDENTKIFNDETCHWRYDLGMQGSYQWTKSANDVST